VSVVTLAVLPFADMSPAHDQDYFSDGLTEELLNQLANIKGLRVTARTSSFEFKGKGEDVRVIGEKLGVGNVLEGSVRKDGKQLRITAQLINSRDGTHLWSRTYDRELSGVFALQEEVAKDVANALSVTLDVGNLTREQGGTINIEAYDKYLQARRLYQQNGPAESRQAAQLLRESVTLDPKFSRAWMLLSYALFESMIGVPDTEIGPVRQEAVAAGNRVLELTPDTWGAQLLRASRFMGQGEWAKAEAALGAAIAAGAPTSGDHEVAITRGFLLRGVGRIRETVNIYEQARNVDPLSLYVSSDLQTWLDAAGRSIEAQAEYERSRSLAGNHGQANIFAMLRLLARKDATPTAIKAMFRRLLDEEKVRMPISHALAEKFSNDEQAREAIRRAIDSPENQDRVRMNVLLMYADRFEEKELTLRAMRRAAIDFRSLEALWLPLTTDLRSGPGFKEIVRATGLVDYWRSSGKWGDFCKPVGTNDFECR
jgi:TolB-like protein/Flp pilus assembly protein TadD